MASPGSYFWSSRVLGVTVVSFSPEGICLGFSSSGWTGLASQTLRHTRAFGQCWEVGTSQVQWEDCQGCCLACVLSQGVAPPGYGTAWGLLQKPPGAALLCTRLLSATSCPTLSPASPSQPGKPAGLIQVFGALECGQDPSLESLEVCDPRRLLLARSRPAFFK